MTTITHQADFLNFLHDQMEYLVVIKANNDYNVIGAVVKSILHLKWSIRQPNNNRFLLARSRSLTLFEMTNGKMVNKTKRFVIPNAMRDLNRGLRPSLSDWAPH